MAIENAAESRKPKWLLPVVIGVALLAIAAVTAVCLRSRWGAGPEKPADPYDTRYARMHDPAYLKELDALKKEQKIVAFMLGEAQAALEHSK